MNDYLKRLQEPSEGSAEALDKLGVIVESVERFGPVIEDGLTTDCDPSVPVMILYAEPHVSLGKGFV